MKRIACIGLLICMAGTATAGGPVVTVMDPVAVEAQTASSGGDNWVGVLMTLLVVAAVLSSTSTVVPQ